MMSVNPNVKLRIDETLLKYLSDARSCSSDKNTWVLAAIKSPNEEEDVPGHVWTLTNLPMYTVKEVQSSYNHDCTLEINGVYLFVFPFENVTELDGMFFRWDESGVSLTQDQ
jgi:hypothetical protein